MDQENTVIRDDYIDVTAGSEFLKMHYLQYEVENISNKNDLICAHGISHNCRVFEYLAKEFVSKYRVTTPDFVGRGKSDWLEQKLLYHYQTYVPHSLELLDQLKINSADWLGTSMGGIIGILIASIENSPIKRLVLNDIGPVISKLTMKLAQVVGNQRPVTFNTKEEVYDYFRPFKEAYGAHSDQIFFDICDSLVIKNADGVLVSNYDPDIFAYTRDLPYFNDMEIGFWEYWQDVTCPVLLIHGENSIALTDDIISRMKETHNNIELVKIKNCGHAPHLMSQDHLLPIKEFLFN